MYIHVEELHDIKHYDIVPIVDIMTLQDNVIAVGSEHSCIFLYSTTSGTLLTRLEGHTTRLAQLYCSL